MGRRSERFRMRRMDALATKTVNNGFKTKERSRRDARMIATVQAGSLPYTPDVMSWLSTQCDKKSAKITEIDVKAILKA